MKRFALLLLVLLLLTGCGTVPAQPTQPSGTEPVSTWPKSNGLYLPGSYLEVQTQGAVKLCPLEKGHYEGLVRLGEDLLLIRAGRAAELMLLTDWDLQVSRTRELSVLPAPDTGFVQTHDGVTAYYDEADKSVVFLSALLAETSRLKLPADTVGTACLSPDFGRVYYCTSAGIHVMDLKTGVDRLLKEQTARWQSVTGVLLGGALLRVSLEGKDGSKATSVLSAESGETVWEGAYLDGLTTVDETYLMQMDSLSVSELIFGKAGEGASNLWPQEQWESAALLPDGRIVTVTRADWGSKLALYDTRSGKCTAEVKLPGIGSVHSLCPGADGNIWMLAADESTDRPVLCGWDAAKSPVEDETDYSQPHYTRSDYDEAGIRDCMTAASALEEAYGVDILIGEDAASRKLGGYGFGCEYLVQAYDRYLPMLEQALAMFPKELYRMAAEKTGSGVLHIGLVRAIYGGEEYGTLPRSSGVQFRQDGEVYLLLAMEEELVRNFCHQLNLVMQTRILSVCTAYYDWDKLNPPDFRYDNDYIKNMDRNGSAYLRNDRAFIDTFSMSFATEDRAAVFAYACMPGNSRYFQSQTMQAKLSKLCDGIRQAFPLEGTQIWEQYLQKQLPS